MKIICAALIIAVAIILISDAMAEEAVSSKETSANIETPSKEVAPKKKFSIKTLIEILRILIKSLNLRVSTLRRLDNLLHHILNEILITLLNIVFNVGWEETYDYLFGNYGMLPIPYFPIP